MGKIRGRDYISWLWQYTAPYAGRIGLLLLFGLLETFASLAMVQITKEIIDHATVGSGFGRLLTGYVLLLLGMQGISVLSTLLTALVTERFSFGIRRQIYEKILHSGWREVTAVNGPPIVKWAILGLAGFSCTPTSQFHAGSSEPISESCSQ